MQRWDSRHWDFHPAAKRRLPETEWELPVVIRFVESKPPFWDYWQQIFTKIRQKALKIRTRALIRSTRAFIFRQCDCDIFEDGAQK
jgi:hypothetical protein